MFEKSTKIRDSEKKEQDQQTQAQPTSKFCLELSGYIIQKKERRFKIYCEIAWVRSNLKDRKYNLSLSPERYYFGFSCFLWDIYAFWIISRLPNCLSCFILYYYFIGYRGSYTGPIKHGSPSWGSLHSMAVTRMEVSQYIHRMGIKEVFLNN